MSSKNYDLLLSYYEKGLWTKQMLYNVVGKSEGITAAEYGAITGTAYSDEPLKAEPLGDTLLYDFKQSIKATLLPVTSDTAISGVSNGRIDIVLSDDMKDTWAIAELAKYELKNGTTRVDSVICYAFSMNKQSTLRVGFRTSGTTEKAVDSISGALILKRR